MSLNLDVLDFLGKNTTRMGEFLMQNEKWSLV
jgi:hypothetical protein